jgi:uncharacterized protein YigA (DUF484 family)
MTKPTAKPAADADQVAAFLLLNPDFLESHPQVFEALDVPHPTGGAVSLVERQVAVLREHNRALTGRLDAVIEAARQHDEQYRKLLDLATALAACADLPALLHALSLHLRRDFGVDALRVLSSRADAAASPLVRSLDASAFGGVDALARARCIAPGDVPAMRSELDDTTASAALLPLAAGDVPAVLLIGAHDAERFSPELGTLLLERLSRLAGAHWHRLTGT